MSRSKGAVTVREVTLASAPATKYSVRRRLSARFPQECPSVTLVMASTFDVKKSYLNVSAAPWKCESLRHELLCILFDESPQTVRYPQQQKERTSRSSLKPYVMTGFMMTTRRVLKLTSIPLLTRFLVHHAQIEPTALVSHSLIKIYLLGAWHFSHPRKMQAHWPA